jgi:hypothetical protein
MSYACYRDVTVRLLARSIQAQSIHPKVAVWLGSLVALAVFNIVLWVTIAQFPSLRTRYAETQLLLSGVYVGVCGFRSIFPRVDLERVCLWDTWLSAILLGRIVATVAEVCFALQCALFVWRLSEIVDIPGLNAAAETFIPLVIIAELACWYAVLSLNHIGHAVEESLWALMMLALSAATGTAALAARGPLRIALIVCCLTYGVAAALTALFDVRMYLRRWRKHAPEGQLTLAAGFIDSRHRWHPTSAWGVWREEVPWMTLYFSVGVWTSLAMVLLEYLDVASS